MDVFYDLDDSQITMSFQILLLLLFSFKGIESNQLFEENGIHKKEYTEMAID